MNLWLAFSGSLGEVADADTGIPLGVLLELKDLGHSMRFG